MKAEHSFLNEKSDRGAKRLSAYLESIDRHAHRFYQLLDQVAVGKDENKKLRTVFDALVEGAVVLVQSKEHVIAEEKSVSGKIDVVSEADRKAQDAIFKNLKSAFGLEDNFFLGEEGSEGNQEATSVFIIDSLDGTRPYLLGYDDYGISLAHEQSGEIDLGLIYAPEKGEIFFSYHGEAFHATSHGFEKVRVAAGPMEKSALYSDFSDIHESNDRNFATAQFWGYLKTNHPVFKDLRYNSAAFGIPDTVIKNGNVFIGFDLERVDVAAAIHFAVSAGAKVWTSIGKERKGFVLVTNGYRETEQVFLEAIQRFFPEEYELLRSISSPVELR